MEKYKSKLIFNKYIINKINFKYNEKYDNKPISIQFSIRKKTEKIENNLKVTLVTNIFENAEENDYPFEMKVELTGYFTEENNEEGINFEPNAIAILYPYIRAIVSTFTTSANVNGLILPVINVNKLIKELEEN